MLHEAMEVSIQEKRLIGVLQILHTRIMVGVMACAITAATYTEVEYAVEDVLEETYFVAIHDCADGRDAAAYSAEESAFTDTIYVAEDG